MADFLTLEQAVDFVADGATLALGGMTLYRRPVAFARALARRAGPKHLTLLSFTAGYESDLLVGSGCVSAVRSVYFGLEAFGLAPMFTQAAASGTVQIIEETEASIVMGLRARTSGVGYIPSTAWVGTDLPGLRPDVKMIADPYSGETLTAFPAIDVDVAVIHGLQADRHGNVLINNNLGIDLELVYVADKVIATVETLVDQVEKSTDGMIIPAPGVDAVVESPHGAWPTSCYPLYAVDGEAILDYIDACNGDRFKHYLEWSNPA